MTAGSTSFASSGLVRLPTDIDERDASAIVRWAAETFGDGLVYTCSFECAVLAHLVSTHAPGTPIVLLDTGYLFAETLWYAQRLQERLGFELRIERPSAEADQQVDQWMFDTQGCCQLRKVEPLNRVLAGKDAWLSGVRRSDSETRANTQVVSFDIARNITKVNPLAAWNDDDMRAYNERFGLPMNPLMDKGYPSIGCWPCTNPVAPGDDPRSGRWSGSGKTECGLHV